MARKSPDQEQREYKEKLENLKAKTKVRQKKAKVASRSMDADDSDIDIDELVARELQREPAAEPKKKKRAKVTKAERQRQKQHVLALADERPKQRISKINNRRLKSIVGDSAEQIHQLLEVNEGDSARTLLYKTMLQSLVDLIPYAENNIRKSKGARGVYQLNSMISSVRELLIDVQQAEDRGRIGELLVERSIAPIMLEIGTAIVQQLDLIKSDARDRMSEADYQRFLKDINRHRDSLADTINTKFYELRDQIKQQMQR